MADLESQDKLTRYLSPINVWALSFGCILGWGAFVMPGSTLLPIAGPVGTIVALAIGGLAMIVIAASIHFMSVRHPDSGGAFTFTKRVFGYDHAFLCGWSLILAYVAIIWANATAVVLIVRFLLGPIFQFGFHYVVAGYDVYFGEILVTLAVLGLSGLFSCLNKRMVTAVNTVLAVGLLLGTLCCLGMVFFHVGSLSQVVSPPFASERERFTQIFGIVALAPWAFIGFESATHGASEFKFPIKKLFGILFAAIVAGTVVYIATTIISVIGTPTDYPSWIDYIAALGTLDGIDGLPVFQAMYASAGNNGLMLLAFVVICALGTSLIGLYRALSRLLYMMAEDEVLPDWFRHTNEDGVPRNAIYFIMAISVFVPFVGRAAIGWIVDVTSISASIAYCYIAACCYMVARRENQHNMVMVGILGIVISALFFIYPLIPNLWSVTALAAESYFILAVWSILGLFLFRFIFRADQKDRFGKSTIVWIVMVFLIMFASTMWVRQATNTTMNNVVDRIAEFYGDEYAMHRVYIDQQTIGKEQHFLVERSEEVQGNLLANSLIQMALIIVSLDVMFNIYRLMHRCEREHDQKRAFAEQSSQAKTMFLSNMSHDIRTPMNAIIGYTKIAQREGTTKDEMREYLGKIDASSQHLLRLINDVLEMSRIESGKMDLNPTACDLNDLMQNVEDLFSTQMHEKGIDYTVSVDRIEHRHVMCDSDRLSRVLLNLLSNAYKFTPEGGMVSVTLSELFPVTSPDIGNYELRVKDSGIGMAPEFAERIFEAFERERTSTVSGIQGTGLGMAITKSIVDQMGGTIDINTAPGAGTEFIVRLSFPTVSDAEVAASAKHEAEVVDADFTGRRILAVEDNDINLEIIALMLQDLGFEVETATNGQEALDKLVAAGPGHFDAVLTDIQMPVMSGYEEVKAIRELEDPKLANIPVVACSANAFEEDVQASLAAGMDGHLAKPIEIDEMKELFARLL